LFENSKSKEKLFLYIRKYFDFEKFFSKENFISKEKLFLYIRKYFEFRNDFLEPLSELKNN